MGIRTGASKDEAYEEITVKINVSPTPTRTGSNGPNDGGTLRRHLGVTPVGGTIYFGACAVYLPFPMDNMHATIREGTIYVDHGWMAMHSTDLAMVPMTGAHPVISAAPRMRQPAARPYFGNYEGGQASTYGEDEQYGEVNLITSGNGRELEMTQPTSPEEGPQRKNARAETARRLGKDTRLKPRRGKRTKGDILLYRSTPARG